MDTVIKILLYIWQLPQHLVGIVLCFIYKTEKSLDYKGKKIRVCSKFPGGISLGNYIFVHKYPHDLVSWDYVKHEYGHSIQSKYLGLFYLLVIGLPSVIWAACYKYDPNDKNKYYRFYTEKWADKLGEVTTR